MQRWGWRRSKKRGDGKRRVAAKVGKDGRRGGGKGDEVNIDCG